MAATAWPTVPKQRATVNGDASLIECTYSINPFFTTYPALRVLEPTPAISG